MRMKLEKQYHLLIVFQQIGKPWNRQIPKFIQISIRKNKIPRNQPNQGTSAMKSTEPKISTMKSTVLWKRQIEEDISKWRDILCSWIGRANIIKWPYYKPICRCNTHFVKILTASRTELEKTILKVNVKPEETQSSKSDAEQTWRPHNPRLQVILQSHGDLRKYGTATETDLWLSGTE